MESKTRRATREDSRATGAERPTECGGEKQGAEREGEAGGLQDAAVNVTGAAKKMR